MFAAEGLSLTAGQYGLLMFFSTALGVYVTLRGSALLAAGRKQEGMPCTDASVAAPKPKKSKVVDWRDSASVLKFSRALLILGAICLYCFVCEKMPMFPQGKRLEGADYYWFFVFLFFVAGFLTLEHSGTNKLLHREQTNEWKGWMQYVFIAYHYCHAEYVYKPVRVFVSTYVWMTGFGNFLFFDKVADYSSVRFLSVMWRLNLSALFLLLALDNSYVLYYIVPLHTLYFVMVFGIMRVRRAFNARLGVTLAVSFAAIFLVWDVQGVYPLLWGWLDYADGGVFVGHEWHFRTGLDHLSALFGMAFGAASPYLSSWLEAWENKSVLPGQAWAAKGAVAIALIAATLHWAVPFGSLPKTEYNLGHPFFVLLPIVTYIFLRNLSPTMRSYHVKLFAWLGTITLETYLMQHHIWLSSNAKTRLVLLPEYPLCNMLLTTVVFVLASKTLFEVTNDLRDLVMPNDAAGAWKSVGLFLGAIAACVTLGYVAKELNVAPLSLAGLVGLAGAGLGLVLANKPGGSTPLASEAVSAGVEAKGHAAEKAPRPAAAPEFEGEPTGQPGQVPWKSICGVLAAFACVSLLATHLAYARVADIAPKPVVAQVVAPSNHLPIISRECAAQLNEGSWAVPEGAVGAKSLLDQLQLGLADSSSRVWKWSFGATKKCGFGIKATRDVVAAARGRWILFIGDSQVRNVYRRLVENVAPILSKEGSCSLNGNFSVDPAAYPFYGHQDFESVWTSRQTAGGAPVVTRISFWWAPYAANITSALAGSDSAAPQRASHCAPSSSHALPDAVIAGAGSWDVLHFHDKSQLADDSLKMNAAFGNLANKPLCASGAAVAEAPGLLWVNAPVTVTSKLSSGLKREYLTNAALDEITSSKTADTPDGIHFSDAVYNVIFQIVGNAVLGPATPMRCSTCKPTLTALPGDAIMGLLAAASATAACLLFVGLKKFASPQFPVDLHKELADA